MNFNDTLIRKCETVQRIHPPLLSYVITRTHLTWNLADMMRYLHSFEDWYISFKTEPPKGYGYHHLYERADILISTYYDLFGCWPVLFACINKSAEPGRPSGLVYGIEFKSYEDFIYFQMAK